MPLLFSSVYKYNNQAHTRTDKLMEMGKMKKRGLAVFLKQNGNKIVSILKLPHGLRKQIAGGIA